MVGTQTGQAEVVPLEVRVAGLSKSFPREGGRLEVLRDISLTVPPGWFVTILGPSGSGNSTLLAILAGLDAPDAGTVSLWPQGGAPRLVGL